MSLQTEALNTKIVELHWSVRTHVNLIRAGQLRLFEILREGPMASQLITHFHNSVSHNSSMHLIACPFNLSMNLKKLITDNPWSQVCVSLPPLLSLPPPTQDPSEATWYIWMKQCITLILNQFTLTMIKCNDREIICRGGQCHREPYISLYIGKFYFFCLSIK